MNMTSNRLVDAVAVVAVVLAASAEASASSGRYAISGGTVFDTKTKLTWQQIAPSATYTWVAAKTYCQQGVAASLGGVGWRLPTVKELQTIVDDSRWNPSIDPTAFPGTVAGYFWSMSPAAGSPRLAWFVDFNNGGANVVDTSGGYAVRCVR